MCYGSNRKKICRRQDAEPLSTDQQDSKTSISANVLHELFIFKLYHHCCTLMFVGIELNNMVAMVTAPIYISIFLFY